MSIAATCVPVTSSRDMTITYSSPYFGEVLLDVTCAPGLRLVGSATAYCDGQQWSSDLPVCVEQLESSTSDTGVTVTSSAETPSPPRMTSLRQLSTSTTAMSSTCCHFTAERQTVTLPTNGTGETEVSKSSRAQRRGSDTLLWYAAVSGSCAVVLAVAGATCGMVVSRRVRRRTFRHYHLTDEVDDESATAESGRSTFYAMRYTELNDEQATTSQTQQTLPINNCGPTSA